MPVTIKVNGTVNALVHKGSTHTSVATIPDVCKTPSPGGPVPIPYPNVSQSATLAKGTTTVKVDGGNMAAIKGSEFSMSNGDNAGVAGGVKSSTFMKESTWILYSFDVKMDGKNACRFSDKKFQNHENTADLAGVLGPTATVADITDALCEDMCAHEHGAQATPKPTNRRSSNDLEKSCDASGRYSAAGVKFRGRLANGTPPAGTTWSTKTTRPDAIKPGSQCWDFKLCGDSWRGDQKNRQANLIKPPVTPITISCASCSSSSKPCPCSSP
jgi:hypothetical protein